MSSHISRNVGQFRPKSTPFVLKISNVMLFYVENFKMGGVFSTGKFDLIRVFQYLMNSLRVDVRVMSTQKHPKKPLSSSTGLMSETLIYHNACI